MLRALAQRIAPILTPFALSASLSASLAAAGCTVSSPIETEIELPLKVAVMGCIVNGPGEAEGADVAVFAGDRRGIIYVQGEKVANVPEAEILDRLLAECRAFEAKVAAGEASLGQKVVDIVPPDPIGDLGSGVEKIRAGMVDKITVEGR